MRIACNNYVKDSTITATSENTSYPTSNLIHNFLEKKYQATGSTTTLTILFPEDRTISMIAIGFHNLESSNTIYELNKSATEIKELDKTATEIKIIQASSTFKIKDNLGVVLYEGNIETLYDVETFYFDEVVARSVVFEIASTPTDSLYIGGLAITNPCDIKLIDIDPILNTNTRNTVAVTDGGQSLTVYRRALEAFQVKVSNVTNQERLELSNMAKTLRSPVFVDLFPLSHDIYRPYYAEFTDIGKAKRMSEINRSNVSLAVEERR